ncbi:hypothetical protein HDG37_001814 [Paraburkholderia sp. MM5384-R2]|nr:hypothetical protein [Paraburkholderia sp. MM5384-R2]
MPVDDDISPSMLAQAWQWIAEGWFVTARSMVLLHASMLDGDGAEPLRHQAEWPAASAAADESGGRTPANWL